MAIGLLGCLTAESRSTSRKSAAGHENRLHYLEMVVTNLAFAQLLAASMDVLLDEPTARLRSAGGRRVLE
jgi:hypothetical protein